MDITIEQATLADLEQLVKLRLAYLTDDIGALTEAQIAQLRTVLPGYLQRHLAWDLPVFVARGEDGTIMSCAWLLLVEKPPSPRFPNGRTGVLFNVYTLPEYRRKGLARRTMSALINEARRRKLDVLELHATDDGYPLYQSLGFLDDSTTHKAMRMML